VPAGCIKGFPFIKVITGLRRTGKSTIMDLYRSELLRSGIVRDDIFYLDLKDDEGIPKDHRALNDMMKGSMDIGKGRYLFFDEIQNVVIGIVHGTVGQNLGDNRCTARFSLNISNSGKMLKGPRRNCSWFTSAMADSPPSPCPWTDSL